MEDRKTVKIFDGDQLKETRTYYSSGSLRSLATKDVYAIYRKDGSMKEYFFYNTRYSFKRAFNQYGDLMKEEFITERPSEEYLDDLERDLMMEGDLDDRDLYE